MAIIYSYPRIDEVQGSDLILVADASKRNQTKSASVSQLADYINLGASQNEVVDITLTSAQLLALNGGGTIELVAAPGVNKLVVPISLAAFLDFNATAYNFSDPVNVSIGDDDPSETKIYEIPTSFLNDNEDRYGVFNIQDVNYTTGLEPNVALNLIVPGTETVTTGDSPLTLSILYRIVDFS